MNEDIITAIYCNVDDFCKVFDAYCKSRFLPEENAAFSMTEEYLEERISKETLIEVF